MGFKPPVYLKDGDLLKTGIEGIGEITNSVVAYRKGAKY
jgi:2-keto-4-pentenoate hydratase/2-oxohepta-3-ene-1,7-dioic acid hydratase in catechol pathway